jgi:phage-related protein (TIGR01555 family)
MLLDVSGRPFPPESLTPKAAAEREDSWQNPVTGIGMWNVDKTKQGSYQPVLRVLDQELTSLYNGSDLAAKVVEKPVHEMWRRGYDAEADGISASETKDFLAWCNETLELEENLTEGDVWGRLYGGSLLILGIDDGGMPWEPLQEDRIKSIDYTALIDRRFAYLQGQYSQIGAQYGKPQVYLVSNAIAGNGWNGYGAVKPRDPNELLEGGAQVAFVHASRTIRFDGNRADVVTKQNLAGWSWSALQRIYEAMRQFEHSFDSVGYLLSDASQGVLKLQGLVKAISSGQRQALADRALVMDQTRSVMRSILIDAGGPDGKNAEEFTRVATPMGGLADVLDRMMARFAGAADMPQTELFGRAPAGMNATGESDTRKWYDSIATRQKKHLAPKLTRILKLASKAKNNPLGVKNLDWNLTFHPLWDPTDDELAETRLKNAQRDIAYIDAGVVKPEEVAVDLGDVYPNLDVEAREEVLAGGKSFEPYPEDPEPEPPVVVAPGMPGAPPVPGPKAPPAAKPPTPAQKKAQDRLDAEGRAAFVLLVQDRDDAEMAQAVYDQLLEDYPATSLGWILSGHWEGPKAIATKDIDTANSDQWQASKDPLDSYEEKIKAGKLKPAILVKLPGKKKLYVVDGHHRMLASAKLKRPLMAYVATVHTLHGPWEALHSMQSKSGKSSGLGLPSYSQE